MNYYDKMQDHLTKINYSTENSRRMRTVKNDFVILNRKEKTLSSIYFLLALAVILIFVLTYIS